METKIINQKAYLERYTSSGVNEEKKKLKTGKQTVKIIDDGEDAPQIAGIVDDRGPVDFTDKRRWKIINEDGDLTVINNSDLSPPRFKHSKEKKHKDSNLKRAHDNDSDLSPLRKSKNYDSDQSPPRQAPILRDKESGRKRNLEAEAAEKYEQEKRQRVLNEQYDKWGKGLKQIKDREERLQDDLYEMSKSLARYADDADLDKQLREELKDGDPMLEYIKQKQIKGKRKPDPLQYQGYYAPNRFRIKPGYRWDGVDRSNGYEKKLFETTK